MAEIREDDPESYAKLTSTSSSSSSSSPPTHLSESSNTASSGVPYRAFLRSPAVLALSVTHFANNFFHYVLLAWLPSYTMSELGSVTNLHDASLASLLPPLAGIAFSMAAAPISDKMISLGTPLPIARKVLQSSAFIGPGLLLSAIVLGDFDPATKMALITFALGVSSLSLGGLFCTHADMSPKYSGALLGITNCAGALSGVIGVSLVGWLLDLTGSFDVALFAPCILLHLIGTFAFISYCVNEEVDFDNEKDNSPFAFEAYLEAPRQSVSKLIQQGSALLHEILPHPSSASLEAARAARKSISSMSMGEEVPDYVAARRAAAGARGPSSPVLPPSKPIMVSYWTVGAAFADDFNASSSSEEDEIEIVEAQEMVAKMMSEKEEDDQD